VAYMLAFTYKYTCPHNPEDHHGHLHRRDSLRPQICTSKSVNVTDFDKGPALSSERTFHDDEDGTGQTCDLI
jgi:hypothetical protein